MVMDDNEIIREHRESEILEMESSLKLKNALLNYVPFAEEKELEHIYMLAGMVTIKSHNAEKKIKYLKERYNI